MALNPQGLCRGFEGCPCRHDVIDQYHSATRWKWAHPESSRCSPQPLGPRAPNFGKGAHNPRAKGPPVGNGANSVNRAIHLKTANFTCQRFSNQRCRCIPSTPGTVSRGWHWNYDSARCAYIRSADPVQKFNVDQGRRKFPAAPVFKLKHHRSSNPSIYPCRHNWHTIERPCNSDRRFSYRSFESPCTPSTQRHVWPVTPRTRNGGHEVHQCSENS